MVEISNVQVYDLKESVIACRNAKRITPPDYSDPKEFEDSLARAIKLAKLPTNSGHPNFLTGIRVAFDIKYPGYFTPQLQRYHFFDIVTSSSKMHRIAQIVESEAFTKYTDPRVIEITKELAEKYKADPSYKNLITLLSTCPQGIELFMRCDTNYMQLCTMYHQRKHDRLEEDWGAFLEFIEGLPYFNEFINPKKEDKK